jgi:ribosomal protein S18 acetylase RimI-like enzyme
MKQKVEIRPVRIDDLRDLFIMGKERLGDAHADSAHSWNEKNLAEIIAGNLEISFVAVYKKTVMGFIIGDLENSGTNTREAAVKWLCVRKSGDNDLAGALLHAFQQCLREKNINKIRLAVSASNAELIELYQKFGFTESEHVLTMENFLPKNIKPGTHP